MDLIKKYRAGELEIPDKQWAWFLYGAGMENFGREGKPEQIDVPEYGPRELLARIDACGICFSDIKIIKAGPEHPRLMGRDLAKDPIIIGHEVALTIIGVGEEMKDEYQVGDRFVVQADVYYNGVNLAFGYMLPGGFEQYVKLGDEILRGDDGCYLIPIE
ncbi:MAG: alcohol dehydrogenase catalytic domain-containing protein, partial [Armatimonadetes bacterium]|nr:alcohol dehydrogenase catalytic domain-containing protein [Armatimonadota bacterium]